MSIYEIIEKRKSIRKYEKKKLTKEEVEMVEVLLENKSEIFGSGYRLHLIDNLDEVKANLGFLFGIGKNNAPHCIIGIANKKKYSLVELGFFLEKVVIELTSHDIATCWLATYNTKILNEYCKVSGEEEIIIAVSFGRFQEGFFNNGFRKLVKSNSRKTVEEITRINNSKDTYEEYFKKNEVIKRILEASIKAPSANNMQPTIVNLCENKVQFFTNEASYLDTGIFMYHFYACSLAEKLEIEIKVETEENINNIENLHYVASILWKEI